ncbi:aminotransferase class III-fold pyridoxal phosphate-dependent enzyme [Marinomonas mediterranea]|uniref:aminotransferase class III-fold pyridoxal phosphate-dependent enzyme n=1 Tax=Marinomonas mediterranea TaxID=119864 RepID=UPI00234AA765|nr:aminotransferase class III-fold pyridoxal phosphate-dependent enzyme [Marinomonas mediterranea]WCN08972.1 aminotransferase class III-fold pyridoxal phosphate-dependent enzyme [Marinomonas mediterranea]
MALYNDSFVERVKSGLVELLPSWGISEIAEIHLLTVSENATFLVRDSNVAAPIILRVHRPNYHTRDEIASELKWIDALRQSNIVVAPAPLALKDGSFIASFTDLASPDEERERYVVAFEFIKGQEPKADDKLTEGFETLGAISARLHQHAENWPLPKGFVRKRWTYDTALGDKPLWGSWRQAIDLTQEDEALLETLCDVLRSKLNDYGEGSDRFGLIHADLRLANLLVDNGALSVIDFDDCGFSWFMYDFAAAISFYEEEPYIPELQSAWLKGYRSVRALSLADENMIPTFILFRRLLLTAWVASHSETETAQSVGLGKFTKGTVALARRYLASLEKQNVDTPAKILEMNAFDARTSMLSSSVERRLDNFGASSVLFYRAPIEMVEAKGAWMTASDGVTYLDFYNNVPCLGHCHPSVIDAVSQQMAKLNTHTRYIVSIVDDYIDALKRTLPNELSNIVLTCSGSEANDLAMRLAGKVTGGSGFIVTECAYHGNTAYVTEVSPSAMKKGVLPPHVIAIPEPSTSNYGVDIEAGFAHRVKTAVDELRERGVKVAALLLDSIFSSDGVYYQKGGFLSSAVDVIRNAGGVYIADEVQPGFARTGETFWGFEAHHVFPDIVTMGKPMGNGFPMAGVATKPSFLATYCQDVGYFNTFGGNPVAAAAGLAVLNTIESEGLQVNALKIGRYIKDRLSDIAEQSNIIGEVRGAGLFFGIDVEENGAPSATLSIQLIDQLREQRILAGAAGKHGSTLKLRPPLCLTPSEADFFLEGFQRAVRALCDNPNRKGDL